RLVARSPLGPFAAMEAALAGQNAEGLRDAVERIESETQGKGSDLLTSEHQKHFQKLLSDPEPENRVAAIKMLVLSGNLDNVPTLILALEDRDPDVFLAAKDGLCRLTRRFDAFGLPDDPTPDQKRLAIEKWKAWYLSVRPDTEF
ncbi:MAG TPA: HEAT repeat domain-containing protein, partial [Thermoguttaceae bacterium]|nr:HEAT repeat domain-containing protein [Thermoguttaceae bacterium]